MDGDLASDLTRPETTEDFTMAITRVEEFTFVFPPLLSTGS